MAKQKRGRDVDHKTDKRERIRGDAGKRQAVHNAVE